MRICGEMLIAPTDVIVVFVSILGLIFAQTL